MSLLDSQTSREDAQRYLAVFRAAAKFRHPETGRRHFSHDPTFRRHYVKRILELRAILRNYAHPDSAP